MTPRDLLPLRTERLLLRRFRPDDLPVLLAYRNDAGLARFQGWRLPMSEAEGREFIAANAVAPVFEPGGGLQIALALAASDELVGDLYLGAYYSDGRQATLGYTLARPHHGRGYASEAVAGLLGLAFGQLGLHRVSATVDPRNAPSIALLERVGMRREGHFVQAYYDAAQEEWSDEYWYALLREEWQRGAVAAGDGAA
jgi:RimJ/RimL family protein N-acetyltransferase